MNDKGLAPVLEGVDLLLYEQRQIRMAGPHFLILHEYRLPGMVECAPGELVSAVNWMSCSREVFVPLSLALKLFFDFLAKQRHPLTASEIVARFRADEFYAKHGSNVARNLRLTRRIAPSAVRVYVERTRQALARSFESANLKLDPKEVLVSEETTQNQTLYRLRGSFEWLHTDHPGQQFQCIR